MSDPVTPNMGLTVPTPTSATQSGTSGPLYAIELSTDLPLIDKHTHTGPANLDGAQLTQEALNLTGDLTFNSNNATSLRSVRLVNNSAPLSGAADCGCLYESNGELWYNEANGAQVQITTNGILNTLVSPEYNVRTVTNTNLTILPNDQHNLLAISTTSSAVTITLPSSVLATSGRFYLFKDVGGNATTNAITIQVASLSGDTFENGATSLVLNFNHAQAFLYTDGAGHWYVLSSSLTVSGQTLAVESGALALVAATVTGTIGTSVALTGGTLTTSGTTVSLGSAVTVTQGSNFRSEGRTYVAVHEVFNGVAGPNSYTVDSSQTDCFIAVATPSGGTTITLTQELSDARLIVVTDMAGVASSSNITIAAPSGWSINGASTYVISNNRGSAILMAVPSGVLSSGNWIVVGKV